jgi:mono/diheme cytochrome c family protein
MSHMFKYTLLGAVLVCSLAFAADNDKIERGKYLTEEIAKCQDCHTPRGENGQLDRTKWMKGATLDFKPVQEVKGWHGGSPDLTGTGRLFQRWGEAGLVKFLVTGKGPRGNAADPPMPAYTLKQEDAEAIVAYLKTLQ